MANPNDNTPADKSFLGTGPFGATPDQGLPDFDYPRFPPHVGTQVNNQYGGYSSSESPNIPEEPATAPIMPFQPNVFQDAEDGQWYFDFETSGVVFLPVGMTGSITWHNHWNEAWPFRPTMVDDSGGLPIAINDAGTFSGSGSTVRKPRLALPTGKNLIIYLEVTYIKNDYTIASREDATGAYSGVKSKILPALSLDGVLGEEDGHDHPLSAAYTGTMHSTNITAPYGTGSALGSDSDPRAYIPLSERNYFVTAAPEIKVVIANDDDGSTPFSLRHDIWRNVDLTRKFPWGSVYIDASTSTSFARLEWWRFDCPTYSANNHIIDVGSSPDNSNLPADHAANNDTDIADLSVTNDGTLDTLI